MTVIELPDQQAEVLKARVAAEGLTLDAWVRKQLGVEPVVGRPRKYNLADLVARCDPNAPLSDEDRAWLDAPSVGREA